MLTFHSRLTNDRPCPNPPTCSYISRSVCVWLLSGQQVGHKQHQVEWAKVLTGCNSGLPQQQTMK